MHTLNPKLKLKLLEPHQQQWILDDPVRPHLSYQWRTSQGRQVWTLVNEQHTVQSIICVAYTTQIPRSELELETLSSTSAATSAVFYTVWSYSPGAGAAIVNTAAQQLHQQRPEITRWVTLSPLTSMAERFHLKNGARLLERHDSAQNFDYTHTVI